MLYPPLLNFCSSGKEKMSQWLISATIVLAAVSSSAAFSMDKVQVQSAVELLSLQQPAPQELQVDRQELEEQKKFLTDMVAADPVIQAARKAELTEEDLKGVLLRYTMQKRATPQELNTQYHQLMTSRVSAQKDPQKQQDLKGQEEAFALLALPYFYEAGLCEGDFFSDFGATCIAKSSSPTVTINGSYQSKAGIVKAIMVPSNNAELSQVFIPQAAVTPEASLATNNQGSGNGFTNCQNTKPTTVQLLKAGDALFTPVTATFSILNNLPLALTGEPIAIATIAYNLYKLGSQKTVELAFQDQFCDLDRLKQGTVLDSTGNPIKYVFKYGTGIVIQSRISSRWFNSTVQAWGEFNGFANIQYGATSSDVAGFNAPFFIAMWSKNIPAVVRCHEVRNQSWVSCISRYGSIIPDQRLRPRIGNHFKYSVASTCGVSGQAYATRPGYMFLTNPQAVPEELREHFSTEPYNLDSPESPTNSSTAYFAYPVPTTVDNLTEAPLMTGYHRYKGISSGHANYIYLGLEDITPQACPQYHTLNGYSSPVTGDIMLGFKGSTGWASRNNDDTRCYAYAGYQDCHEKFFIDEWIPEVVIHATMNTGHGLIQ
jgi:hypothetical protein